MTDRPRHGDVLPPATTRDGVVTGRAGDIPVRDYLPARPRDDAAALLWIHGGAWAVGGLDQRESHAVALAVAATGRPVRTIDYRLVPRPGFRTQFARRAPELKPSENRYPAALHDILDVVAEMEDRTGGPIHVGGASAGANLASVAALDARDAERAQPAGLVLVYGAFHRELPTPSPEVAARLRGPRKLLTFSPRVFGRLVDNYLGADAEDDHPAFPGGLDLSGLPPALFVDADVDSLRGSSELFAEELRDAGVDVDYVVVPGTYHGFLDRPRRPGFGEGVLAIVRWLDARDVSRRPATGTPA